MLGALLAPGPRMRTYPIVLALAVVFGCGSSNHGDPLAPGATGSLSLPAGATVAAGSTLELRACAASVVDGCAGATPATGGYAQASVPLGSSGLPATYSVGADSIGVSSEQEWQVVAWISSGDPGNAPASGDRYGKATFALSDCSGACGAACYCGSAGHVDLTLDQIAP